VKLGLLARLIASTDVRSAGPDLARLARPRVDRHDFPTARHAYPDQVYLL